jgi:hypothetical protein
MAEAKGLRGATFWSKLPWGEEQYQANPIIWMMKTHGYL